MPSPGTFRSLLPLAIGFVLLLVAAAAALLVTAQQQSAERWVQHTLEVEAKINQVGALVTAAESSQRGFLLTGRVRYLEPYQRAFATLTRELDDLDRLIADNPRQKPLRNKLRTLIAQRQGVMQKTFDRRAVGDFEGALAIVNTDIGLRLSGDIGRTLDQMRAFERALLDLRSERANQLTFWAQLLLAGSIALVLLFGLLALLDSWRKARALQSVEGERDAATTEKVEVQDQLRQLQKMEAVGQLTGGIAHDFNNMLAIVIGSLDIARKRMSADHDPTVAKCIDNAMQGAERAATLTARLLAFSRQQPLDPKAIEPNKLVAGMSELLRRTIGEQMEIETVLAGGLWRIMADPSQVETALVNLAVNARDAMPDGGKLTIETANCDLDEAYARNNVDVEAGHYVMMSVSDTGTGMTADVIERAFDPFYTTKAVGSGTGLGLSQIFGFAKQSGGHVKIYSEVGHGTTVKLYLPRYIGERETTAFNPQPAAAPQGKGELIFVVEDEAQVRHMSVDALRMLGYTVMHADNPAKALSEIAAHEDIALVFTDIVMPGMSGREMADQLHETRPDLKILYTTGYTRNAIVHGGVIDRGTAFLPKPFTVDQLARKVREVLDGVVPD